MSIILLSTLTAIEHELVRLELWEEQPPAAAAFQSTTPFFADTMEFHQWLQFVLIPQFKMLIENDQPLPENVAIAPMAEVTYRDDLQSKATLIKLLHKFDSHFS